jgi:hypothetical protein
MFTKNKQFLDSALNKYIISDNPNTVNYTYYGRVTRVKENEITINWISNRLLDCNITVSYDYESWEKLKYCRILRKSEILKLKLIGRLP